MFMNLFTGRLANLLIAFVNVFLLLFNVKTINIEKPEAPVSDYVLTFSDEFDEGWVNCDKWNTPAQNGVRKGGYWSMNQCRVEDGNLVIKTEYKEDGQFGPGYYTDRIDTRNKYTQKYGYFECRAKVPAGHGFLPRLHVLQCLSQPAVQKRGVQGAGHSGRHLQALYGRA